MSGAAFLRLAKLKGSGTIGKAARHNRRAAQGERRGSGSIDPNRSRLNETLAGPPTADEIARLAKDRMRSAGILTFRKDQVFGLELVFSLPADHTLDDRAYFTACLDWTARRFGGESNVLSADIHRDESTPHCHVLLVPIRDQKLAGSQMMGNRGTLLSTQTDFHESVASTFGLSRPPARLFGKAKSEASTSVLDHLRLTDDPAIKSSVWGVLRAAIDDDPGPFMLALGVAYAPAPKRIRTFTDIFISAGKGKAKREDEKPIGFEAPQRHRNLSCVGFSSKLDKPRWPLPVDQSQHDNAGVEVFPLTRIRDDHRSSSDWNEEQGEFSPQEARQ